MSSAPYRILRQGALPEKDIKEALADGLKLIGITGTTGSGKTTALSCLEKYGAMIIDCDALYHDMLISDEELKGDIAERFPEAVKADGSIDRKALGKTVFADAEALLELNAITHRHIGRRVDGLLGDFAMAGGKIAALDAVELISAGMGERCDFTVAVVSDKESRIERIMARDGISREDALRRVNAQKSDEYYIENCTYALKNDSSFEEFENKCEEFFGGLLNE